jgi:cell wall-associated NlpC family hydrolase
VKLPGKAEDPAGLADVVKFASSQLGKPYVFGSGADTSSFDCSDLVQWAYKQIGISIPRVTQDQVNAGREVGPKEKLKPGDLIFPHAGHVVMYVGNGKVIAAPYTGTVVQYQDVPKRWRVRRIL